MGCEPCLMLSPEAAELPLEVFVERFSTCTGCALLEGEDAPMPVRLLARRVRESARALRKLEIAVGRWEGRCKELQEEAAKHEERIEILERIQMASTLETEAELQQKMGLVDEQRRAILALSAPILEVGDGIIAVPVIGAVDADRAEVLMRGLLDAVNSLGVTYAIIDLTGVDALDTETVRHLLRIFKAVRLLGARIVATGVRAQVARSMVALGADVSSVATLRNVREALREHRA